MTYERKRTRTLRAQIALAALAASLSWSQAAKADLSQDCNQESDWNLRIAACTEVIRIETQTGADLAWAYHNRGVAFGRTGQHRQAIQDFDRAASLNPKLASIFSNRGIVYRLLGQDEQALEDFEQALRIDPGFFNAYIGRGNLYLTLGKNRRAIQDYDQAIRLNSDLASAYSNRGIAYAQLKEYQQAIQDYDRALRLDPDLAKTYSSRGDAYQALAQHKRAVQDYDKALKLDPENAGTNNKLAWALYLTDRPAEGLSFVDRALRLRPNTYALLDTRAHILADLGRHDEARAEFEKAMSAGGPDWVRVYQRALQGHGYDPGVINGSYGTKTRRALEDCLAAGCRLLE